MKTNFNTDEIKVVLHRLMFAVTTFIKWLACSVVCGVVLGLIGTFFYKLLGLVTVFRETNPWILFGLPVAGLLIRRGNPQYRNKPCHYGYPVQ